MPSDATPRRKHPAHGVEVHSSDPTIIFLTVCTRGRSPWLACADVHRLLVDVWREADAWLVGRYVIMPDHIHLFAGHSGQDITLDAWVRYWKSQFSKRWQVAGNRWQTDHWDTRLRNESYDSKWEYVRRNPVRLGLVSDPDDWKYQGELHVLELGRAR